MARSVRFTVVPTDDWVMARAAERRARRRGTPLEELAATVCWCRHDVARHVAGGCVDWGCLCLDPPELVRWWAQTQQRPGPTGD